MEDTIRELGERGFDGVPQILRPFARFVQNFLDTVQDFFHAMSDREIVGLILLINLLIVVVYLLVHLTKRKWKKGILLSVFMLVMPIVGPMYLLSAELFRAIQRIFGDRNVNMEELSFDQSRVRQILEADTEKDRNIVPLEEALIISDSSDKRNAFLEMIKENDVEALNVVRAAVEDSDAEIAHYAASYVTDMLTRVKEKEVTLYKAFEEEQTFQKCDAYVRYLRNVLRMEIFEGPEQRRYLEKLENAYLWLLEHAQQTYATEDMTALAHMWMNLNSMEKAKQWIDRVQPLCYEDLDVFKTCATYYYRCHNRDALFELLNKVRGSALTLDSDALDWIRFFDCSAQTRQASGGQI